MRSKKLLISLLMSGALIAPPANSAWWASEWTQIANNVLLGSSLVEQGLMVANEIETALNTYNTYKAAMQDLAALPQSIMDEMLSPFNQNLANFTKIGDAVDGMNAATVAAHAIYKSRAEDMRNLSEAGFEPAYYAHREQELAEKSVEAQQLLNADRAAIAQAELRQKHVADLARDVKIESTVSGLEKLASIAALAIAEQGETNKILLQGRTEADIKKADDEAKAAYAVQRQKEMLAADKAAVAARNAAAQARRDALQLPGNTFSNVYQQQQ